MIYEAQCFSMFTKLFECFCDREEFSLQNYYITLFDCTLLTYFLCSINHCWKKLDITGCSLSVASLHIFNQVYQEHGSEVVGKARFKSIDFSQNSPEIIYNLHLFPWSAGIKELIFHCNRAFNKNETPLDLEYLLHIPKVSIKHGSTVLMNDRIEIHGPLTVGTGLLDIPDKRIETLVLRDVDYSTLQAVESFIQSSTVFEACNVSNMDMWITRSIQNYIVPSRTLQAFTLCHNLTVDSAVCLFTSLEKNTSIEKLVISGSVLDLSEYNCTKVGFALQNMLLGNKNIKSLQMHHTIDNQLAGFLMEGISKNATLQELDVDNNDFAIDIMQEIIAVSIERLRKLCIEGDEVCNNDSICTIKRTNCPSCKWFCALAKTSQLMSVYSTITSFHIGGINLGEELLFHLFQVLQHNQFVKELSIDSGVVTDKLIGSMLGNMLAVNNVLEELICQITDEMSESFAHGLSKNTSLKILSLEARTTCRNSSIMHILKALQCNQSIEKLKLEKPGHLFTLEGSEIVGSEFETLLTNSSTLTELSVQINDAMVTGIINGLLTSKSLKKLEIWFDSLTSYGVAEILLSVSRCISLTDLTLHGFCSLKQNVNNGWHLIVDNEHHLWPQLQFIFQKRSLTFTISSFKVDGSTSIQVIRTLSDTILNIEHLKELDLSDLKVQYPDHSERGKLIGTAFQRLLTKSRSLERLNLSNCWLPSGVWKYAVKGLQVNKSVKFLSLSKSNLIVDDAILILNSLRDNQSLNELDLSDLSELRGGSCFTILSNAFESILAYNNSIQTINLKDSITDTVAKRIAIAMLKNTGIRRLDFSEKLLTCQTIQQLLLLLENSQLKKLQLTFTDSGITLLSTFKDENLSEYLFNIVMVLKEKDLYSFSRKSSFECTYKSSKLFCGLSSIISTQQRDIPLILDVSELKLDGIDNDMAITIFRILGHTRFLLRVTKLSLRGGFNNKCLSGEKVGRQLKIMLENNKNLLQLELHTIDDNVAEGIIEGLHHNTTLQQIRFDMETLNDHITACLLESMTKNVGLIELHISGLPPIYRAATSSWYINSNALIPKYFHTNIHSNFFRLICALCHIRKEHSFPRNHAVETVVVSLSKIKLPSLSLDTKLAIKLFNALTTNCICTHLDVSMNEKLVAGGNEQLCNAITNFLSKNTQLESLNFSGALNYTTANGLIAGLENNKTLKCLHIDANVIKMETIVKIVHLMTTTGLISLTVTDIFTLRKCELSLWQIEVIDTVMWPKFLSVLKQTSPKMQILNTIHTLSNISGICIRNSPKFDSACENLCYEVVQKDVRIKDGIARYLNYRPSPTMPLLSVLTSIHSLINLTLSGCDISDNECQVIESWLLSKDVQLKILNLSHNFLSESGKARLFNVVKERLEVLDMSYNNINMTTSIDDRVDIENLLQSTCTSMTLRVLNLEHCGISDLWCTCIGLGIKHNQTLVHLNLSHNIITNVGVKVLLQSLQCNSHLQELDLSGNIVDSEDEELGSTMCQFLQNNEHLLCLNFDCKISDSVLTNLATGLSQNQTLRILTLDVLDNYISVIQSILTNCKLDRFKCSEIFSLSSSSLGWILEIKSTNDNTYLSKISKVIKLEGIVIYDVAVSKHSSSNLNFESLDLVTNHLNSILNSLKINKSLVSLTLKFSEHHCEDASTIGDMLKVLLMMNSTLRHLNLLGIINDQIADGLVGGLLTNHSLEKLGIEINHLTEGSVLAILQTLEFTNICQIKFCPVFELEHHNDFRSRWKVTVGTEYKKIFTRLICRMLQVKESHIIFSILSIIEKVVFDCNIDDTLAVSLLQSFENNYNQIKILDLSGMKQGSLKEDISSALETMLLKSSNLQELILDNTIDDSIAFAIARGMLHNDTLQRLDVDVTYINDDALNQLLQSLSTANCLSIFDRKGNKQILSLKRCSGALPSETSTSVKDKSPYHFLSPFSLLTPFSLPPKTISHCFVLGKVFRNLKRNCNLRELMIHLPEHFLSNASITTCIQEMLKNCLSLTVLKFCTPITDEVIAGLGAGLKCNRTLQNLTLNKKNISWINISPIFLSLNSSAVSKLEFTKEFVFQRMSENTLWKVEVVKSLWDDDGGYSILCEIHDLSKIRIDSIVNKNVNHIKLHFPAKNNDSHILKALVKSIKTGSCPVRTLILSCSGDCSTVAIGIEQIFESKSLKKVHVHIDIPPNKNQVVHRILKQTDFTKSSLTTLEIGNSILLKRSEEIHHTLSNGDIIGQYKITSPWKVSCTRKDDVGLFYSFLRQLCTESHSSLCHLALQSLTHLDLSHSRVDCIQLANLLKSLYYDVIVTNLDISYCKINGALDVIQSGLLEMLLKNYALNKLDLTGMTAINDKFMKEMAGILAHCSSPRYLSMSMTSNFGIIETLLNNFIRSKLNILEFTDICLLHKNELDTSWYIDLSDNCSQSTWQRDLFRSWSILFMLTHISKQVPHLKVSLGTRVNEGYQLKIFQLFFTDNVLVDHVKSSASIFFQSIRKLSLEVTSKGVPLVKSIIRTLQLSGSLQQLCLFHSDLSSSEGESLGHTYVQLLSSKTSLEDVDIRGPICDTLTEGIATGLLKNSTLKTLQLSLNGLQIRTLVLLLESLHMSNLKCLHITDCCIIHRNHIQEKCCDIEVTGGRTWSFTGDIVLSNLFYASLTAQNCCKSLQEIFIVEGTLHLSGSSNNFFFYVQTIQEISVSHLILTKGNCSEVKDLLQLPLKRLELHNCHISDLECEHIANELATNRTKTLEVLDLSSNDFSVYGAMKLLQSLAKNSSLQELNLSQNDLSKMVDELDLDRNGLIVNKTLSILHLTECGSLCEYISDGLRYKYTALQVLSLQIKVEEQIIKLLKSLEQNQSLQILNIAESSITTTIVGSAISEMLRCNKTLRDLNMHYCGISDEVCKLITEGLAQNKCLRKLDLSSNRICDMGVVSLFQVLDSKSCCLQELNLSFNWKDSTELECNFDIGNILSNNTELKVLSVSSLLCFREWFGRELLIGLQQNSTLNTLDISENYIGVETSAALTKMVSHNTSITILTMLWNSFNPWKFDDLARALKGSAIQKLVTDPVTKVALELNGDTVEIIEIPAKELEFYGRAHVLRENNAAADFVLC